MLNKVCTICLKFLVNNENQKLVFVVVKLLSFVLSLFLEISLSLELTLKLSLELFENHAAHTDACLYSLRSCHFLLNY